MGILRHVLTALLRFYIDDDIRIGYSLYNLAKTLWPVVWDLSIIYIDMIYGPASQNTGVSWRTSAIPDIVMSLKQDLKCLSYFLEVFETSRGDLNVLGVRVQGLTKF